MENKTDATLEFINALSYEQLQVVDMVLTGVGVGIQPFFSIIAKYNGDIEAIAQKEGIEVEIIGAGYAALKITPTNLKRLVAYPEIVYMEAPKQYTYTLQQSNKASCITSVQNNPPYNLKGKGTILAIIDSGITYNHPDFRNEDGSTRILSIWDQTIEGNPPAGFKSGTEYTAEQINLALREPTRAAQLAIVPSQDTIGHGTHVASIAGGNGRASNGSVVGAAPEASYIIVKLGVPSEQELVQTINIMLGVRYAIERAREWNMPVAINISLGSTIGSHDGKALIEKYLDDMAQQWKVNIAVGSGNEGNARNHIEKKIEKTGESVTIQLQIANFKTLYRAFVWQSFIDIITFRIVSPTGESTPRINYAQGPKEYIVGGTKVYTTFAGPSPLNGDIEFAVFFAGMGGKAITSGVWRIIVYGEQIINGQINMWGATIEEAGGESYILDATPYTTLTTPSTASSVLSVGAYDSITNQIAPFSGRGYTRGNTMVKPDLVAPGVNILAASNTGGYQSLSGTSMATPHVTGAIALLMEWGIVQRRNIYLYGENLKTYLLRGTNKEIAGTEIPDPRWGYGKLCVKNSLDILVREEIL